MDQGLVILSITAQRRLRQEEQDQAQDQLRLHRKSTKKKKKTFVIMWSWKDFFFLSKKRFIYFYVCMFCLHGCMCTMFLPAACPQRPKGAGSQGTGIPDGVIDHIGAWNQIQVFLRATSAVKCGASSATPGEDFLNVWIANICHQTPTSVKCGCTD